MDTNVLLFYLLVAIAPPGQDEKAELRWERFPTMTACTTQKSKQTKWSKTAEGKKFYRVYNVQCIAVRGVKSA